MVSNKCGYFPTIRYPSQNVYGMENNIKTQAGFTCKFSIEPRMGYLLLEYGVDISVDITLDLWLLHLHWGRAAETIKIDMSA